MSRSWLVALGSLWCCTAKVANPEDPQQTTGGTTTPEVTTTTGAPSTATSSSSGGPASGNEGSGDAGTSGDSGGGQKFDVSAGPSVPNPCSGIGDQSLPADQCFELGLVYPPSDWEWALVDDDEKSCALVCLDSICVTDVCSDFVTVAVVHGGPRVIIETPNAEVSEMKDPTGETIQTVEGFDDDVRYHVVRSKEQDTFSVWATDDATGETVWGPLEMHRYQP